MKYDFLKQFPRRMKQVGMYALLSKNCALKNTFSDYGLKDYDDRVNLVFAVLLFIMEQSLKDVVCTRDDIAAFTSDVMEDAFGEALTFEESTDLAVFIVDVILSNEGNQMDFGGFDFEKGKKQRKNIRYLGNSAVTDAGGVRRTSYHLTDDGYSLVLSTLEIESHMKLTIKELIFKMHLDKKSYDQAEEDIKGVFNLLRIQLKKMQEAMEKIRRNALSYSVTEYRALMEGDLATIQDTKKKFQGYQDRVTETISNMREKEINESALTKEERQNLEHLDTISTYLKKSLDEHQKILDGHFDVKILYDRELAELARLSLIHRFSLRNDFYDKIPDHPEALDKMEIFLRPLFNRNPDQMYNPGKALSVQKNPVAEEEEDKKEVIDFNAEDWEKEMEEARKKKRETYDGALGVILKSAAREGKTSLKTLSETLTEKDREKMFPSAGIFKEIMVELIKAEVIDVAALRKEKEDFFVGASDHFQVQESALGLIEKEPALKSITKIFVKRRGKAQYVTFHDVPDIGGEARSVRCSDIVIEVERRT